LVVAVDMPLSHRPIVGRRRSDDEISRVYGGRHCSTHSPSALRPGSVGEALQRGLEAEGFELATTQLRGRSLVEVYPHPALVELTGAPRRLPYKVGKLRSYWPNHSPSQRREALLAAWREIVAALETKVAGVAGDLQMPLADAPIRTLKSVEDRLDAVVCAWVGACIFEGRALAHGDAESAIWTLIGAA
jgi:predicted RNase H-like nuclease